MSGGKPPSKKKNHNKYLGKRVKDINRPGLDSAKEFRGIMKAIWNDYMAGRISKKTAQGRLLLLYSLTFKKNNSKISHLSNTTLSRLRREIKDMMEKL